MESHMTKAEFIDRFMESDDIGTKAQANRIFDHAKVIIKEALLNGESVALGNDFGTFKPITRAARTGVNPTTKASIQIPASKSVKFSIAAPLKRELNK